MGNLGLDRGRRDILLPRTDARTLVIEHGSFQAYGPPARSVSELQSSRYKDMNTFGLSCLVHDRYLCLPRLPVH
jgi:hypothetical protein